MSVFTSLLNHDFNISRRRRTSDGQGGWAIDYVTVGTVRGRIRPASSAEREAAAQESRQLSHVLYVLAGTDIARGDEVEQDELVVDVMAIREPSRAGEHLEIDCFERQVEATVEEGGS